MIFLLEKIFKEAEVTAAVCEGIGIAGASTEGFY